MDITAKTEATEADLQEAYDRARRVGLFLVEKHARDVLRDNLMLHEFVMAMGRVFFVDYFDHSVSLDEATGECNSPLQCLFDDWDDVLKLTGEPMRFTADGPVRREW